jgi:hypothetical protein
MPLLFRTTRKSDALALHLSHLGMSFALGLSGEVNAETACRVDRAAAADAIRYPKLPAGPAIDVFVAIAAGGRSAGAKNSFITSEVNSGPGCLLAIELTRMVTVVPGRRVVTRGRRLRRRVEDGAYVTFLSWKVDDHHTKIGGWKCGGRWPTVWRLPAGTGTTGARDCRRGCIKDQERHAPTKSCRASKTS